MPTKTEDRRGVPFRPAEQLIVKDNRIPPKGFNKAAYQADGAFIVPVKIPMRDGQNWDETAYTFDIPEVSE